jgi:homoserine kinase
VRRSRVVRVPASSANLGPGFDVMAAAVGLWLQLEVVETGTFSVVTDLPVAADRSNLVVRAFERLAPAGGFQFRIHSEIPLSGGLGSSAAAVLAGLAAADHLFELDADLPALATELEGHPDNVGAALRGGFVICDGSDVRRVPAPDELEAVLVVPAEAVTTSSARAALPDSVPLADAVANVASAATLTLGLVTSDWDLIAAGLRDRLHQGYRAPLYPRSAALLDRARAFGALGATISGAGPTVLVWCRADQTGPVVQALRAECEGWAEVLRAPFTADGLEVSSLG